MPSALKDALEDLLRTRRLQADLPPLRGERRISPLPTGIAGVDRLLGGGFPRGQVSEIYGPPSSGRTGLALALAARSTRGGSLAAWVDPTDRLDPFSAAAAGVDLERLLWLRGPRVVPHGRSLSDALSALGTLLGSGLFEVAVFDLAGIKALDIRRLPGATWIRLQRMIEAAPTVLLIVAEDHIAHGPGGTSLGLHPSGPRWSGRPGPGRLLNELGTEAHTGHHGRIALTLRAFT
jgi:hypothetical protein